MANTVQIGSTEFKADLAQMDGVIGQVSQARDAVKSDLAQITSQFDSLHTAWDSPAGETYDDLRSALQHAMDETVGVLDDIVDRLKTTYANYENAETTNAHNVS